MTPVALPELPPHVAAPHMLGRVWNKEQMEAFALAERAAERERCAKIAEEKFLPAHLQHEWEKICSREIASAIRAQTIRESAIEGKGLSAIRNQP